jgi:hypothetical protein
MHRRARLRALHAAPVEIRYTAEDTAPLELPAKRYVVNQGPIPYAGKALIRVTVSGPLNRGVDQVI